MAPKQAWDPQNKEHFPLPPVVRQLWPSSSALHHEHPPLPPGAFLPSDALLPTTLLYPWVPSCSPFPQLMEPAQRSAPQSKVPCPQPSYFYNLFP